MEASVRAVHTRPMLSGDSEKEAGTIEASQSSWVLHVGAVITASSQMKWRLRHGK